MAKKVAISFVTAGFLLYLALLFYMLFRGFGRDNIQRVGHAYNLIPFHTILADIKAAARGSGHALRNLIGNLFLLSPLGFFLPFLIIRLEKAKSFALVVLLLIATAELAQFFTGTGSFDVDDILLNLLGALIGLAVCKGTPIRGLLRWRTPSA